MARYRLRNLLPLIHHYPLDYEILRYLGEAFTIVGQPRQARRTYLHAERIPRAAIARRTYAHAEVSDARSYLARLQECVRALPRLGSL